LPTEEPLTLYAPENNARAKVSHLLLSYEGAWRANTRRTKENARKQAEAYYRDIQNGVSFGYLAQQYSEDPQKKAGGLIGVVGRGQMVKEFEDVLFNLQINETSSVVETGFGFHILRRLPLEERRLIHIEVASTEHRDLVSSGLQSGEDPRILAREFSVGPHGIRGGELGWFERPDLNPIFVEPVFALEVGTCTTGIERDDTWHFFCRQE
jgi:parvulin-like peptidyl-prolyl isomerase